MFARKTASIFLLVALFAPLELAQSGGTIDMSTNAVTSGGERSSNGNLLLESSLGQPVVGTRSYGGPIEFYGGFWSIFATASTGAVGISPTAVTLNTNTVQVFLGAGGFTPYNYSIVSNVSGSSIDPATGGYTSGPNGGIDIVRVTDAKGNFAEATVTVIVADVPCPGGQKLWDGGGFTNNWSDAANWCGNVLPDSGSVILFNGTSSKNAIVDTNSSVNSFNLNAGFGGTVAIAAGKILGTAAGSTFNSGSFDVGGGTLDLAGTFNTLNGGTINAGSGTVNISFFLTIAGGTFNGGSATLDIPVVNVTGGSFVSSTGTMSVSQNIQRTGGTVDLDNGTIVFTGPQNGSVSGTSGPFKNLSINKADNVGVSFAGTNVVNGTLTLTDGLINTGTLEARGNVTFASTFGQATGAGAGVIAFRPAVGVRTVNLPSGVSLPDITVDDANITLLATGPGAVQTDSITLINGTFDFGSTGMTFGSDTGGSGSHYVQTGGSFNISTGDIVWNTFGNFTLDNGTFNAGSGAVHLGGNVFTLSGGTFTPSTGSNTFNFSVNNAFEQTGGVFETGAGSVDVNGRFTLSGGTFNASAGNTNFGFVFDHTAGTFNNNAGTVIFDSPHPAYSINVPGNPGTGNFHNLVMNPSTPDANIAIGFDVYEVNGYLHILNGRFSTGNTAGAGRSGFVPKGDVTIEAAADGGNVAMYFEGGADQSFISDGAPGLTGSWTVAKTSGAVTMTGGLTLTGSTPLNIDTGTFDLGDGSSLTTGSGAITIGAGGRLASGTATNLVLGGDLINDGRVDLQGGGTACPEADSIVIRSTINGVVRNWSGSGSFRIVDADIKDMGGTASITAFSSTDRGNAGNWTFDGGCPAQLGISPQSANLPSAGTQTFSATGGQPPYTFSLAVNNSGGSLISDTGVYTAGSTAGVTDTIRVTDAFGATADATVNVVMNTVVTNTSDSGPGSLRQAIINANAIPESPRTVTFDIPGNGPHTITVSSQLPSANSLDIDGRTQPGYGGVPLIEVRSVGASTPYYGLITSGTSTVRGLAINGFEVPLLLSNCLVCSVQGNYVGVEINGTTQRSGLNAMQIVGRSIDILVGGNLPEHRNLIASLEVNGGEGVRIRGNYFGLDASGNDLAGGSVWGIKLNFAAGVQIGSDVPGGGNMISGFSQAGILIEGLNATNPPIINIRGNKIGTDAAGTAAVPNAVGILSFRRNVFVGGTAPGEGNLIAFNGKGVVVSGERNPVRGNSIHSNGGLGIDLTPLGVSSNDFCDLDSGGNLGQNFPVITDVAVNAGSTDIGGYLATGSPTTQNYTIDLYSSPSSDSTGHGEGMTHIGSTVLTIPSTCAANPFNVTLPVVIPAGHSVTATATDPFGNTSEFSAYFGLNANIGGRVLDGVSGEPLRGVIVTLLDQTAGGSSRISSTDSSGKFEFSNLPQGHDYFVRPGKRGHEFSPESRSYTNLTSNQFDTYTSSVRPSIGGVVTMLTNQALSAGPPESGADQKPGSAILPPPRPVPAPVGNVTITVTDDSGNVVATDFTDDRGEFFVPDLGVQTYTITPSKQGFTFIPPSITLALQSHVNVSFAAESPGLNGLFGRFIYDDGAGRINSINANGTGVVNLINAFSGSRSVSEKAYTNYSPSISRDGAQLAFAGIKPNGEIAFRKSADDGSSVAKVISDIAGDSIGESAWSPDGGKLAYVRGRQLHVVNADGTNDQSVCYRCSKPDWSPDGSRLLVISETRIATVHPDGTNLVPFQFTEGATVARWSNDGTKIAFAFDNGTNNQQSIEAMNADGSSRQTVVSVQSNRPRFLGIDWSPDDNWIGYVLDNTDPPHPTDISLNVTSLDGLTIYTIDDSFKGTSIEWGIIPQQTTPVGTDVVIRSGAVSITFPGVTEEGFTSLVPITSAGPAPNLFVLSSIAFEVNTSATFLPSPTICVGLDPAAYPAEGKFNLLSFLHQENGVLVDRTSSRDFPSRTICAQVESFSPFVVAEQVDPGLPSVSGVVVDSNGRPMRDVPVVLYGEAESQVTTDIDGYFRFVNLSPGSNYLVEPRRSGYLFDRPYASFLNIQDSNRVAFTATAGSFDIGGSVRDETGEPVAGVRIRLAGGRTLEIETDSEGNYSFADLPANGSFRVIPVADGFQFTPLEYFFNDLQSDLASVDFTQFVPAVSHASISGRVRDLNGSGLPQILVTIQGGPFEEPITRRTTSFGYFRFADLPAGESYIMTIDSKQFVFDQPIRFIQLSGDITDMNFVGDQRQNE
ncbi:MAG: carboxypeptidase regulatory-like domain-containing protein [Acidobacteriota bacterium]|nr:MAG: carboxypeptidase regulatory-like domain-containing protein [Acidobacteriota bacterium]